MFGNRDTKSPVAQPYVWVAEYLDGTHLSEFDYQTTEENDYYKILRNDLLRFGLLGDGCSMYFEVYGGVFKILGQMLEMTYVTDDKTYLLTGQPMMYSDIITHKDAEFIFNPKVEGSGYNAITQYNFGYKAKFSIDGVNFSFKAICQVPMTSIPMMEIKIVASESLNGRLHIKKNGRDFDIVDAPIKKNKGGHILWQLR